MSLIETSSSVSCVTASSQEAGNSDTKRSQRNQRSFPCLSLSFSLFDSPGQLKIITTHSRVLLALSLVLFLAFPCCLLPVSPRPVGEREHSETQGRDEEGWQGTGETTKEKDNKGERERWKAIPSSLIFSSLIPFSLLASWQHQIPTHSRDFQFQWPFLLLFFWQYFSKSCIDHELNCADLQCKNVNLRGLNEFN